MDDKTVVTSSKKITPPIPLSPLSLTCYCTSISEQPCCCKTPSVKLIAEHTSGPNPEDQEQQQQPPCAVHARVARQTMPAYASICLRMSESDCVLYQVLAYANI